MNALIFTVNIGHGHTQVAGALKDQLEEAGHEAVIVDALEFVSPFLSKVLLDSYLNLLRFTPEIYGKLYNLTEHPSSIEFGAAVNNLLCTAYSKLVENIRPDVIVCTHSFAVGFLSALKGKLNLGQPLVAVITDFTIHNSWVHSHVDSYVYASERLSYMLEPLGIDPLKASPTGIPVRRAFDSRVKKKAARKSLNIRELPTVLFMGGGLGIGATPDIIAQVDYCLKSSQIIIITGKNEALYSELSGLKTRNQLHVLGYVDNINLYMAASDLLVTKPGGVSGAEALCMGLPMALISSIPGQEWRNAEFLTEQLAAVYFSQTETLGPRLSNLLGDRHRLNFMSGAALRLSKPRAARDLTVLLEKLC